MTFEKLLDDYLQAHDDVENYTFNNTTYAGLKADEAKARAAVIAFARTEAEAITCTDAREQQMGCFRAVAAENALRELERAALNGTEVFVVVAESGDSEQFWRHVAGVYETLEAAESAIAAFKKKYETAEIEKLTIGEWQ